MSNKSHLYELADDMHADEALRANNVDVIDLYQAERTFECLKGIVLVFVSTLLYVAYWLISKYLLTVRHVPFFEIVFMRSATTWVFTFAWWVHASYFNGFQSQLVMEFREHVWLFVRCLTFFAAAFTNVWALVWLAPGDAATLWQLQSVLTLMGEALLFKEDEDSMTLSDYACTCVAFIGVILLVRPPSIFGNYANSNNGKHAHYGAALMIMSTIFASITVLITRYTESKVHCLEFEFLTATFGCGVFMPLIFAFSELVKHLSIGVFDFTMWRWDLALSDWAWILVLGVVGCAALWSFTKGIDLANVPYASQILFLEVPLVFVGQIIFFATKTDFVGIVGIICVMCATIFVASQTSEQDDDDLLDDEYFGMENLYHNEHVPLVRTRMDHNSSL